jgi:outer membrane lipoprotein SlyB
MERAGTNPIFLAAGAGVLLFSLLGTAALTGVLPSANTSPGSPAAPAAVAAKAKCANCGVIENIRAVEVKGETSGVGAVAGGVAGGLVGNQFGHGGTRTLLTIGGAAGGAYAGNAIEKNMKTRTAWRIHVRLDDGSLRTLSRSEQPAFAVGERVRITDAAGIERV